jgi:hypothetical protein
MALVEKLDHFEESAHLVLEKNRELPDLRGVEFLGGWRRHFYL